MSEWVSERVSEGWREEGSEGVNVECSLKMHTIATLWKTRDINSTCVYQRATGPVDS